MKKTAIPEIWKKLIILGEKQGAIKLKDLAQEMDLEADEALGFLRQIFPVGIGIEIYNKDQECWVDIKSDSIQYMLPLAPAEWIQLHQILSISHLEETIVTRSLRNKVTENGPVKLIMEVLNQLDLWDQELNDLQQKMVHQLDQVIMEKQLIHVTTLENKKYSFYPCKIVHLEGQLSVIAEDSQDHCLLVIPMKKFKSFEIVICSNDSKVAPFEVEEFITAIRAMSEKETRLILKIYDPQSVNLFPDHHFLGKPCMITNPSGDLIWAAYVEPCEPLYDWLMTLGKSVEILDPIKFKIEYLEYCEEKLKKIA